MEMTPEDLRVQFLFATLRFGLSMMEIARTTQNRHRLRSTTVSAIDALRTYRRFRPGIAIPMVKHEQLCSLAIQLAQEILAIEGYWP